MGYWGRDDFLWGDGPADEVDAALEQAFPGVRDRWDPNAPLGESAYGIDWDEAWANSIVQGGLERAALEFQDDIGRPPSGDELKAGLAFSLGMGADWIPPATASADYDEDEILYDDIGDESSGWEPEEEDLATNGYELWEMTNSGGTWVSNGRSWDLGPDWQGNIRQIMDDMSYWPNVWWVDDHGGMQLVEWDTVQQ